MAIDRGKYRGARDAQARYVHHASSLVPTPLTGAIGLALMVVSQGGGSGEIDVSPTLDLTGYYSDNIELEPADSAEEAWILAVTPGLSARATGRRLALEADYRLQNLNYWPEDRGNRINHQLQGRSQTELLEQRLFFDANAGIRQQSPSPTAGIPLDNVNPINLSTVYTAAIGPRWQTRLADWADVKGEYRYGVTRYDSAPVSDSNIQQINTSIKSGKAWPSIVWTVDYQASREDRNNGDDFDRQNVKGRLAYSLNRTWSLVGLAGYTENDINTERNITDGTYWAAGLRYAPSEQYSTEATFGPDYKIVTVTFDPSPRTRLQGSWQNTDIGINTGTVWRASAAVRARRWRVGADYRERVTTVQRLALETNTFTFVDPVTGEIVPDPAPGQVVNVIPVQTLALTDDVFVERIAGVSLGVVGARTAIQLRGRFTERRYLDSNLIDVDRGIDLGVNHRLGQRSSADVTTGFRRGNSRFAEIGNRLVFVDAGLTKGFAGDLSSRLAFRHTRESGRETARNYRENRAIITLNKRF